MSVAMETPTSSIVMETPTLNVPGEISFFMQAGLTKDVVTVDMSELNLKTLKDLACNFIDRKVRN